MPPRKRSAPLIGTVLAALVLVAVGANVITNAPPAAAATTAGCGKAPRLNSGTHTIQSGGKSRSFILRLPDSYNNTYPHRLAFGFHWLGGTASAVASGGTDGDPWAYYGMLSQSNNTTIFVAPQGINNGWANTNGEDVTFTDDMIRMIDNALCVDTTQRFSVGFSYGGAMSYSLACSRPTVFRAVAAIAAAGADQWLQRRDPTRGVPGNPRHQRQHPERPVTTRQVAQEQRLRGAERPRARAGQPDPHHHHLLVPGRLPGGLGPVRRGPPAGSGGRLCRL